ncbi:alcohol dehydrogenase catalytic domain-containing protein [Streptomyces sp. B21-108]|uniref:alcohol dehydrogenase catalytic domain-containing protein n=1 Tax=Streptomyces sp. B21-108 TaxID=3039419 RepID=UPI002FF0AC6F
MSEPGPGEVVVEVRAAGINPFDAVIRSGVIRDLFPVEFPSGQGYELAGVVVAVGAGVEETSVGDEVLGWTPGPSALATHAAVPAAQLLPKPARLGWEAAGALHLAGSTAHAALHAVSPGRGRRSRCPQPRAGSAPSSCRCSCHHPRSPERPGVRAVEVAAATRPTRTPPAQHHSAFRTVLPLIEQLLRGLFGIALFRAGQVTGDAGPVSRQALKRYEPARALYT